MGLAVKIYEAFKDDETKARVLADVIESLEQIIKVNEVATRSDIKNTELALTKEIEQIRKDMKETELKLSKEIEKVRADLSIDIEKSRAESSISLEKLRSDLIEKIEEKHSSSIRGLIALFMAQSIGVAGFIVTLFQILR